MKFWGPAIVGFLLAVVPAQAGVKLPAVEDHLSLYEKQLIAKANQDTRPSIELLRQVRSALAAGKTSSAIDALEILAGKHNAGGEGGFGTWLKLALAYQARMTNEAKSLALSDGTAAAYGAYKRADTDPDRIAALSALGSLLLRATALEETEGESPEEKSAEELATEQTPADKQNREAARAMAYTVFTELGHLVADDRYQATLEKLEPKFRLEKATYPPRPDQYSPDSYPCSEMPGASDESADGGEEQKSEEDEVKVECENSRAQYSCLVFSRSVGSNPDDVAAAISVRRTSNSSGAPVSDEDTTTYPALVQDKKVCYGLEFGASYKFIVDQSLKSASGESLDKKTVARLKMPDKGSLLGFKRGTYVLPKVGERSITIDTVNTKRAQLMLRRIGDRNLVREILLDHIVKGFADNSEESCFVLNEASERIADGSVTLPAPQSSRNQSIPLTLPIDTILETRRQWLVEDPSAKERTLDLPVKDAKLSFDLRGDPAAATLASESGVFALFGTITEPLIDDAAVKGDAFDEETCADRRYASQWFIITDTGLTLQTSHKYLYVIARSLSTTRPLKDVKIEPRLSRWPGPRDESNRQTRCGYFPGQAWRGNRRQRAGCRDGVQWRGFLLPRQDSLAYRSCRSRV